MEARKTDPLLNGLIEIMEKCWAQDPMARPPIDQVVRELERLQPVGDDGAGAAGGRMNGGQDAMYGGQV